MILSDKDIKKAIKDGLIVIDPLFPKAIATVYRMISKLL